MAPCPHRDHFRSNHSQWQPRRHQRGRRYLQRGHIDANNSTVSGNRAGGSGGGIFHAPNLPTGNVNIFSSTIAGNTSGAGTGFGGGIANVGSSAITFQNTILAGNRAEIIINNFPFIQDDDCRGTINSDGHNLMGVQNCTVSGFAPIVSAAEQRWPDADPRTTGRQPSDRRRRPRRMPGQSGGVAYD